LTQTVTILLWCAFTQSLCYWPNWVYFNSKDSIICFTSKCHKGFCL